MHDIDKPFKIPFLSGTDPVMLKQFLEGGQARIKQTLQRGYAPAHFTHNLELILVEDSRSSTSLSMRSKLASTRDRIARLRTLDPVTLIWWAVAFPMRQWSGGRKMSSCTFAALVWRAPDFATEMKPLLGAVMDDLKMLAEVHRKSRAIQDLLLAVAMDPAPGSRSITQKTDGMWHGHHTSHRCIVLSFLTFGPLAFLFCTFCSPGTRS